jgi:trans-aconitate methyltransferase
VCTGLHTIVLVFREDRHLCHASFDSSTLQHYVKRRTVGELVEEYHLHWLLDCRKLVEVYIHRLNRHVQVAQDLADWMRSEFAKKG